MGLLRKKNQNINKSKIFSKQNTSKLKKYRKTLFLVSGTAIEFNFLLGFCT